MAFLFHLEENEADINIYEGHSSEIQKNTKRGRDKHETIESYPSPVSIAAEPAHVLYRNYG